MKAKSQAKNKGWLRNFFDGPVRWWDAVILLLICAFCFLCYEMRDLYHTAGCSYGFLDGHFADFYDYLAESGIAEDGTVGLHASYLPTIYLLFALWNIPMKLFGIVPSATAALGIVPIMWAKLLPCLAFFASGYFVYRIGRLAGMEERKAKVLLYVYLGSPVAVFSQFVLGQYESILVLLTVMGVFFWLQRKHTGFLLCFMAAVTVKYTALILFLPLLMLREKNIMKIVGNICLVFALFALEYLLFRSSPAFSAYAFGVGGSGDAVTGYITNASIFTGFYLGGELRYVVYLTYLAFAFVCAYAYFTQPKDRGEECSYAFYLLGLALASFFCLSKWHPHWLMLAVPFWAVSALLHRNTKVFMAVDLLFGVLFILFTVCQFDSVCDEVMLEKGVLKYLLPGGKLSAVSDMKEYMGVLDMSVELSLLTAVMAVYGFFNHPKYAAKDPNTAVDPSIRWMRARLILPVAMFVLVSLLVLKNNISGFTAVYQEERRGIIVELPEGETVSQSFTAAGGTVRKLVFPVSHGANESTGGTLTVEMRDESGEVLYSTSRSISGMREGELLYFSPGVPVEDGGELTVNFTVSGVEEDSTFGLLGMEGTEYAPAEADGVSRNYHLDMIVYQ